MSVISPALELIPIASGPMDSSLPKQLKPTVQGYTDSKTSKGADKAPQGSRFQREGSTESQDGLCIEHRENAMPMAITITMTMYC